MADPSLPIVPKQPGSAYSLFVKDWFLKNKAALSENGKINSKDILNDVSSAWTTVSEDAKAEFNRQAKEAKSAYDKEYKSFFDGLSPESIKAIEAATGKKLRVAGGLKNARRAKSAESGLPQRPLTAFFMFMQECRNQHASEGLSGTALAKKAGQEWRDMSADTKAVSQDLYSKRYD
jgi:hypothetical protein